MTREEARLTLQENFGYLSEEHPRIVEALKVALDVLGEPSLPDNLDEAAHDYAWEKQDMVYDAEGERLMDYGPRYDAFKAGAEWMAEQGVNSEGEVFTSAFTSYVKTPGIEELLKDAFPEDTEVIVQVRKKH